MTTPFRAAASRLSVRTLLVVVAGLALVLMNRDAGQPLVHASPTTISDENRLKPGATDWDITSAGDPDVQGYATDISVNLGQTVHFKIAAPGATAGYKIDIYRLGYYGGAGATLVTTVAPSAAMPQTQPPCLNQMATTGLVDCGNWAESGSWAVPATAVSGIYVAKLTRFDNGHTSHIVFVVRDDARTADIVFQTSDTTWQAYNQYPGVTSGGASLYCGGPLSNAGSSYLRSCATRAAKVSYNRPFDTRAHDPQSWLFNAEYPMVRWLEANGYDVKYQSGIDTDRRSFDLTGAHKPKTFLSVGHDEYWSAGQRLAVETARNAGVSLAFLSGNEMYWKTRYEPSIDGSNTAYRTLVTYKETIANAKIDPAVDPVTGKGIWTGTWRDPRFAATTDGGKPENGVTGQIFTVNCCSDRIKIPQAMGSMRLWSHTGVSAVAAGDFYRTPEETLGYEWDEDLDNGSRPAGMIRLSSTTLDEPEKLSDFGANVAPGRATHALTMYRHNSGAIVFGAGTVQWSWGLDGNHDRGTTPTSHTTDQAMEQATVNLLADMGAQPATLQVGDPNNPRLFAATKSTDIFAPISTVVFPAPGTTVSSGVRVTITGTSADQGGGIVSGVEVSVDGGTTWKVAQGTTLWSFDWTPGVPGPATIKVRAIDDSGNLEAAGVGSTVVIGAGDCPCTSLWRPTAAPTVPSAADSNAVELGVQFNSDIDGFITGIRFYKGTTNTGTHIGNLWSSNGIRLATAEFSSESASGWQQVLFATPVSITANTLYVASYHTNVGSYSADGNYFATTGVDSPPLHALQSTSQRPNGLFSYGQSQFPLNSFNATNYWVDVVFAPSLSDSTPPQISSIKATTIDSARVTLSWKTDEPATSRVDYGTDPAILTASIDNLPPGVTTISNGTFVTQHTMPLTGLTPNTTYYYLITAIDHSGNATTVAAPTFSVPGPTLRDTASSDFAAATAASGTYVAQTDDGELTLAPTAATEFTGPSLSPGWIETPWSSEGYSIIVDGVLLVDGARVASCARDANGVCLPETPEATPSAVYTAPHTLEFTANFSGDRFQHAGLGQTFASTAEPWAIFSTLNGGLLFARTNNGTGAPGSSIDTGLGTGLLGSFHRYKIDWRSDHVDYYVDGALVASHLMAVPGPMRPVAASDFNPFGGTIFVDWMRMTPYAPTGTFESRIFDASAPVAWHSIQWTATTPAGTSVAISARGGNSATPDATWSAYAPMSSGGPITLTSRYVQYRAVLATSNPDVTPQLEDITISTGHAPVANPDSAIVSENGSHLFPASGAGSLTANDTDADAGDVLRVAAVTAPGHGTAFLDEDGSVRYTPVANYAGPDAFVYTVSDGLLTSSATVSLDVRFGNVPPVAVNDFYSVNEDATLTVPAAGVLANDTDTEHDPLSATLTALPLHGTLIFGANGGFTYTPTANYAGPDSFRYKASDGGPEASNEATVTIDVAQVNDPPITVADAYTAVLNQPLDVPAAFNAGLGRFVSGVLANDHDVEVEDTAPLHAQLVSGPLHGHLTLGTDGGFSYVPDADFLGADAFTYQAVDHFNAAGNVATVTITVALKAVAAAVNAGGTVSTGTGAVDAGDPLHSTVVPPTAATVTIAQGVIAASQAPTGYTFLNQQVNISVLDPNGVDVAASPSNPIVLSFAIDQSLVPAGQDFSTFEMFRNGVRIPNCLGQTTIPSANLDPCVTSRAAAADGDVLLTIITSHASRWNMGLSSAAIGNAPVATSDGPYPVDFQTPIVVSAPGVLANDIGRSGLTASLVAGSAANGTVTLTPSGAFTFIPSAAACGAAGFSYTVTDESGASSNTATVSIAIDCRPRPTDDAVTVLEDSGVSTITVLANDTDPDAGQTLSVASVTSPANGVSAVLSAMAVTYRPNPNFFGSDSFTYTVSDGHGGSATATVNVTVTPVNDVPSFSAGGSLTVLEDATAQTVANWATNLSAGPANESSQALNFIVSNSNAALFSVQPAVAANGTLTFTPAANANGAATVSVQVHDTGGTASGGVDTSLAQAFTITVTAVNDAPSFTKGADQAKAGVVGAQSVPGWATTIGAGPADEAGQALNFIVSNNNNALFAAQPAVAANGTLTYTPAANAIGSALVTVSLHDNGGTANGGADTSAPQTFTIAVSKAATTASVSSSLNPSVAGQAVTFTAALAVVAPGAGIPAGTVTFMDGAAALGSATLDAAGKATLTTAALAAGGHSITAVYAGAGVFAGSTSAVLTQTVGAAGPAATKTVVTSSNATSLFGVPITLTATVSPIAPATGIVAGTVTFKDGTVVLGTATLSAGAATFTTSTLAVGTHAITAAFGGSATFAASTSAALSQVIQPSATLKVNFKVHAILDATTKPKVQDIAVPNALVRVYSSGDSCAFNLKVSTQPKRWGIVFDGIDGPLPLDPGCPVVTVGSYRAEATTDVNGNATIIVPPTAATQDWIVIGRTTNFDYIKTVLLSPDPLYSEDEVLNIAAGQTAAVMLNQIAPFAGGILPAKRIVEFGTELDIVEPDDYDWTDDTAQYPFVLVANGAWDVSTNIAPPSGFVPDVPTLAASVADTTSAIQFTLTDVGSDWTQTNVTHVINHKGTTRIRTDAIRMFNKKRTKAKPDFMTVDPGSSGNVFNVLANDNVAPPKTLTITAVTAAANGTVTIGVGAQTVVYTPNAGFSGRDQFTYTIDDGQGAVDIGTVSVRVSLKPSLVVADTSAAEGNSGTSPLSFTVTLSSAVDVPVMVDYATADGSALAGTDYAYASGTLVFAPGETVKTATVSLIGNTVFQTNRTFALQLSNAENAKIFGGVGKATIVDDDPKPVISISANSVVEGNAGITPVTVTLTLTGSTAVPASADYATADGTAAAGTDYTAASGTVTFAPGETVKTFVVSVLGDVTPEATEAFTVNIVNTTAATGGIKTATVSIIDDDSTAWVNTSVADFKAGTVDAGGYISQTNNGEVILAPTLASEFKGKTLDAGWTSTALAAGGAATLGIGGVTVDGAALVGGTTTFAAGRSVEFSAKFSGAAGQNAGFTATSALTAPFAVFGTKAANTLLARSVIAGNTQETAIAGFTFNQIHKFRIDWNATTVAYWVDDKKVATHTITLSQAMRPAALDATVGDGALFVEYIRMTPYAAAGTYTSGVFDAGAVVTWMTMSWTANLPAGTSVGLKYRTGNTPTPDATWTALTAVNASGAALAGSTRYLQFVVQESTTDKSQTPVLKDVTLAFKR